MRSINIKLRISNRNSFIISAKRILIDIIHSNHNFSKRLHWIFLIIVSEPNIKGSIIPFRACSILMINCSINHYSWCWINHNRKISTALTKSISSMPTRNYCWKSFDTVICWTLTRSWIYCCCFIYALIRSRRCRTWTPLIIKKIMIMP